MKGPRILIRSAVVALVVIVVLHMAMFGNLKAPWGYQLYNSVVQRPTDLQFDLVLDILAKSNSSSLTKVQQILSKKGLLRDSTSATGRKSVLSVPGKSAIRTFASLNTTVSQQRQEDSVSSDIETTFLDNVFHSKTETTFLDNVFHSKTDLVSQPQLAGSQNSHHDIVGKNQCVFPYRCNVETSNPAFFVSEKNVSISEVMKKHPDMEGGHWQPKHCHSNRLALVIPYRNRERHLYITLINLITFLKTQYKAFDIYVIEQAGDVLFNRASLLNIGVLEATKRYNYSCFIFHDVDMIPNRLCNLYECPKTGARHMAVSINSNPTKIWYEGFMGGVMALSSWAVRRINGFTNIMYGWGGEDDDVTARLNITDIPVERYHSDIANYTAIKHVRDDTNPRAYRNLDKCYQTAQHYKLDGLHNVDYKVLSRTVGRLFINITVELPGPKTLEEAYSYFDEMRVIYGRQMNITDIL